MGKSVRSERLCVGNRKKAHSVPYVASPGSRNRTVWEWHAKQDDELVSNQWILNEISKITFSNQSHFCGRSNNCQLQLLLIKIYCKGKKLRDTIETSPTGLLFYFLVAYFLVGSILLVPEMQLVFLNLPFIVLSSLSLETSSRIHIIGTIDYTLPTNYGT